MRALKGAKSPTRPTRRRTRTTGVVTGAEEVEAAVEAAVEAVACSGQGPIGPRLTLQRSPDRTRSLIAGNPLARLFDQNAVSRHPRPAQAF
jgi:hypothetical protein